jgi:peptide/nickel transport system substrate-binding protein
MEGFSPPSLPAFTLVSWDEGEAMIFHQNEHYWGKDSTGAALPYLDAIKVSYFY